MAATNFDKVVEQVQALNDAEKWRLRDLLDIWLAPPGPQMTEEEVDQEMLREGILDQVPPPIKDVAHYENYKPIDVQGEPLSETIMKERR
jgi:hypothetical protein